jgi:hypothetical protein
MQEETTWGRVAWRRSPCKDNAVDVLQQRVVEKGQKEEVKKETNLSTSLPRVYWITQ